MSLFGAMNTAISGMSAQSSAFGNISDNVANSQTLGYKRVDTSFIDYLTTSTASNNIPGAVVTRPDYVNNVEGTITQTDNPLALAITGQGFFAVSKQAGTVNNLPTFELQKEYTRAGDFKMNKSGFLVNSAGLYLNGWPVTTDPTTGVNVVNQNTLAPIQVSQTVFNPIATTNVNLSANLPATPAAGTATATSPITSDINVYDTQGTQHTVTLKWQLLSTPANTWQVDISTDDGTPFTGSAQVTFGTGALGTTPAGTVSGFSATNNVTPSPAYDPGPPPPVGQPAYLQFAPDFGLGSQTIQLNLGNYGETGGL